MTSELDRAYQKGGREPPSLVGLGCPEASPPGRWRQLFPACPGIRGMWGSRSHDLLVCVGSVLRRKVCRPTVGRRALPLRVPILVVLQWQCQRGSTVPGLAAWILACARVQQDRDAETIML